MAARIIFIYLFSLGIIPIVLNSQQLECNETFAYVLGSILQDEKGYTLASSDFDNAIYVGGIKGDSAVIVKINYSGKLDWARAFDIVPGKQDHIMRILVDSDEMITASGIAGTTNAGGTVFVFRYNPSSNIILWSTEIRSTGTNYNNGLIQKGTGGNYLMINNPQQPNNILEIIEIDKNTGELNNQFSKHYDLTSSESLSDALYHNGKIYGTGRFSFSPPNSSYRNTLLRLNGDNGNSEWCFLGHKGSSETARLYGVGLVLDQDFIYSVYCGDEDGTSIDQTNIFIQKTTEDGVFVWLNRYNIPGANDWADEIIKSGNGFIILCRSRTSPSDIVLYKINDQGSVLWAKKFDYADNDNGVPIGSSQSQLLEADQHIYFTAFSESPVSADMIIVKTDLEGNINDTCVTMTPLNLVAENIPQITWFSMEPDVTDYSPTVIILSPIGVKTTNIQAKTICQSANSVEQMVHAEICMGDIYEGYSSAGQYIDHFISQDGCDSIRILLLLVTSPLETHINRTICEGDIFLGYDSTGIYIDTFQTVEGCDSIRILNLTITNEITSNVDIDICLGDMYNGYNTAGVYIDTFQSTFGCDSIVILHLTVIPIEKIISVEICSGSEYENYSSTGVYVDTLTGINSLCDTIRQITLSILPPIETLIEKRICTGETYFGYNNPGLYIDTIVTDEGCDSVRTVNLSIIEPLNTAIEASVCEGSLLGYITPGTYIDTLVAKEGCDSIRTLVLTGEAKYIPNVFSPNDDGVNDQFTVFQFPDNSLQFEYFAIFDRFGDMTYETVQWPILWDGKRNNGQTYNPAVFSYVLIYNCNDNKLVETGNITLIR